MEPDHKYSSEYTRKDTNRKEMIDTKKKTLYDNAKDIIVTNSVTNYSMYLKKLETLSFRIKAQIYPEIV